MKSLMKLLTALLALCMALTLLAGCGSTFTTADTTGGTTPTTAQTEPTAAGELDENLTYYADIVIEDYGTITVKLEPGSAPITVANFVKLAQSGFYDGLTFHRIMEGFMMQGGDPNGNGTIVASEQPVITTITIRAE